MENIKKDIKNKEFKKMYLLYGDEDYLKIIYKNALVSAAVGDDTMNFSSYEGKDININEIIDTSKTLPFFAERRVILIERSGVMKSSNDELAEAIKDCPDTTMFIFVEDEVDKRNKVFKAVSSNGYACEMKALTEAGLLDWLNKLFYKGGKRMSTQVMTYFINKVGQDMYVIENEANKLIYYVGEREIIEPDDVDAICITETPEQLFKMIDAIADKNQELVMKLYSDLVALKEPPLKMLVMLGKHFTNLLMTKSMMKNGLGSREITEKLATRPFFANKYMAQAKRFSTATLREAVEDCVKADNDVKTGKSTDTYVFELIIMKYSANN